MISTATSPNVHHPGPRVPGPKTALGVFSKTAPHQGITWSNSTNALGLSHLWPENRTGQSYRARYYDPAAGRFLSEDPTRFFQDTNFYFYVQNRPANFVDPSGLQELRPRNLPPGTPEEDWQPFADGFAEALNRLKNKDCAELFGPCGAQGVDSTGFNTLFRTNYLFEELPQGPRIAAQTIDVSNVMINSAGAFMTAGNGFITLPDGLRFFLLNKTNIRAFVLLHELGHQLKGNSGFTADVDAATNSHHSILVLQRCFPETYRAFLDFLGSIW